MRQAGFGGPGIGGPLIGGPLGILEVMTDSLEVRLAEIEAAANLPR